MWQVTYREKLYETETVFLSNPSFLANDFLSSSICGVQVSFSSTVIPSNRDFDTHSIVEFPMKTGGILAGG